MSDFKELIMSAMSAKTKAYKNLAVDFIIEAHNEKIQSLKQDVARLKEENQNLLNFRILDNERLSKKIFKLDEENKRLKDENLKMRNCENCIHYDMVTECELTAITCTSYNKWEIRK